METTKKSLFKDQTLLIGIVLLIVSLGIFLLPEIIHVEQEGSFLGIFFMNFFIAVAYLIIVSIREIGKFRISCFREKMEYLFLVLILFLISAYSLNREMVVFQLSTTWVQIFLTIQGLILLFSFLQQRFPSWIRFIYWICLGIILMFHLYLSLYLIPIYPFSIVTLPFLGISLHAFVPIGFLTAIFLYLSRKDQRKKLHYWGFGLGILLSIAAVLIFMVQWNNVNQIIVRASDKSLIDEKNDLPEWTVIAQRMPLNQFSEKFLKTGLVYSESEKEQHWKFFEMPSRNFDEVRKHDPFIMLATFFYGAPALTTDQKIKILEAMYDSRHKTQERLWNGRNLQTSHVVTNVRIYPNLHISYTEKIITIKNNRVLGSWNRDEEAIYTFHLPEGSVVTSLSLWIHGKEEKAVLTSKQKADTAYRIIVGVQRHDPSLIRWQEGNTVSVRVFPCSPDEDHRFKIGITSPLQSRSKHMEYENIWFEGPACSQTTETVQIRTMDPVKLSLPPNFEEKSLNTWVYEGSFRPLWQIVMPVVPVGPNNFNFDGKSYRISSYEKSYSDFRPGNIYLDVNKAWTREEFNLIRSRISSKIFVYQNIFVEVTDENAEKLFDQLTQLNFSLFPFYEIKDPEYALIITKGSPASCNVSDLGDSDFARKLKTFAAEHRHLKLYNLNDTLSPYLKTLKELRVFDFDAGSASDLIALLTRHQFASNPEDPQNVVIHDAAIRITENQDTLTPSNAPDHLMRLFTYNQVMVRIGTQYFDPDFNDSTIVDEAHTAYVVSPVSSLVVLETAQDYERFKISDDGTSLKNASMKSSGAVPEPHEWILIMLIAGSVGLLIYKRKKIKLV